MQASLSFEQAPPFSVPLRFFLTAPLFGIAAGLLLISGDDVLASRWHPVSLALTHLMVAGFLLQVMAGALFQFVPVVTGGNVRWPRIAATLIHPALTLGAVLLVLAFLDPSPGLFAVAALTLGAGLLGLVVVIGLALVGGQGRGETLAALRGALLALCVTALLGVCLALALGGYVQVNVLSLLEAHQAWGLGGWALLLLAGVSWSVVPMFQITPAYPRALTRLFPLVMLGGLALLSLGATGQSTALAVADVAGKGLLILAAFAFAASTLVLQARRKRKTADATLIFFRVAMIALLSACLLAALMLVMPTLAGDPRWPLILGTLLIGGVLASAVCGMLYKIVPFLIWLHLQNRPRKAGVSLPTMNRMISAGHCRRQLEVHLVGVVLLLSLPWVPSLAPAAGGVLVLSFGGLLVNLLAAIRTYWQFKSMNPISAPKSSPDAP